MSIQVIYRKKKNATEGLRSECFSPKKNVRVCGILKVLGLI